MVNHILSLILWTPLAGALVIMLVSGRRGTAIRRIALGSAAAAFLFSVPLWFWYQPHGKTWQFAERGPALPSIGTAYYIGVDGFGILLLLLTTLVMVVAIAASRAEITERVKEFHVWLLALDTGLLAAFMALDFVLFFLGCQIALVAMGFLIGQWGSEGRRRSTLKFFVHTAVSRVLMLAGILALYFYNYQTTGSYSFDITHYHTIGVAFDLQWWVFLAFFLAFAVSVPLIPLHTWMPDAQRVAPTAGSIVLCAVALKMGTYGFIRFSLPILPDASRYFAPTIATLAILGVVYGGVVALAQRDWKRLIAYASLSQMAIVMLGMLALTPNGVAGSIVLQMNHGLSVAALFLIARIAYDRRGTDAICQDGNLWKTMPVFASMFLIVTLASIGALTSNGFVGTSLIVDGTSVVSKWWAAAVVVGIVLGAGYLLRLYQQTVFGATSHAAQASLSDLTLREAGVLVPLTVVAAWISVYPAPLLERIETSVGRVVARVNPVYRSVVAQGSDCATPAPPEPATPPPEFLLVESCADGSRVSPKPADASGPRK